MSVLGIPYIRIITETVNPDEIKKLKRRFFYIHLYSYRPVALLGFSQKQQAIGLIDLSPDERVIFGAFKKNTRNEIRKTERRAGLTWKVPDEARINSYRFYKKVKRADGVAPDIRQEFTGCLFFNAYLNNKLVISMSCYQAAPILRLKHLVSVRKQSDIDSRIVGYASRRLIWEICRYGKRHGYRWFDLAGVNLTDPKKSGVAQFKQSFGGNIKTAYVYQYATPLFDLIKKITNLLGKNIN